MKKKTCLEIFHRLYSHYGPQGWWPIKSKTGESGFDLNGYHKNDYSLPQTIEEKFEIIIGVILTQNTTWKNVEKAIENMQQKKMLHPSAIINNRPENITQAIRCSGYYNQKMKKLKTAAEFFLKGEYLNKSIPLRRETLLSLWGIGPETADSILLYCFGIPYFVVDAYTKRLFTRLEFLTGTEKYNEIQNIFLTKSKSIAISSSRILSAAQYYNEYHSLIVKHAKEYCTKNPVCNRCPVEKSCNFVPD